MQFSLHSPFIRGQKYPMEPQDRTCLFSWDKGWVEIPGHQIPTFLLQAPVILSLS